LPFKDEINLKVYDISGKEIKTLFSGIAVSGNYEFNFDGTGLPSGVYFYKLTSSKNSVTKKMILIK